MSVEALHLPSQTFRIGAVSRLTGVNTSLIRMWEKRYQVVKPVRTDTGNRLYTQEDIARLALIKQLLDSGDAIGSVASLRLADLEDRVDAAGKSTLQKPPLREPVRIAVAGHALTARASRHRRELRGLELIGLYYSVNDLRDECEDLNVDVLVVEYPYVRGKTFDEIQNLMNDTGAKGAVVVYGFGAKRYVRRLEMLPVITLRAPVDIPDLNRASLAASARAIVTTSGLTSRIRTDPSNFQSRRYSDAQLARIATLSTVIECECPHHLADLVLCLASFEQYSEDCVHRNEEDVEMHRYLHATAAHARSLLETALARLIKVEGLEV